MAMWRKMKTRILLFVIGAGLVTVQCAAQSPLDQILQTVRTAKSKNTTRGLTNDRIVAGLKEALTVSTRKAVASTGRPDGFLKNEAIKILVPDRLRNVAQG